MFLNDTKFKWDNANYDNASLHYKGSKEFAQNVFDVAKSSVDLEKDITETLQNIDQFSSGVIETPTHIIAWVDHIKSHPLFYYQKEKEFYISPNARKVKNKLKLQDTNKDTAIELAMSGYITGKNTIYKKLYTIQPGEFIIWNKKQKLFTTYRYFQYIPDLKQETSEQENITKLGIILDKLTKKIINRAKGKTIWIPLSAGLDSRIILCKLHEHGYSNVQTFTYGPRFNFEAKYAKKIAQKLNMPWRMVIPNSKTLHNSLQTKEFQDFLNYADGLKTIPCMREFSAIQSLSHQKDIKKGDIFINGQSGDYITGAHISNKWLEKGSSSKEDFLKILIGKHYDLWRNIKTAGNIKIANNAIEELIPEKLPQEQSNIEWAKLEENWEYEGRQICYVAHGQRIYEFFGYKWEMPLWEKDMVDFCRNLSLKQKAGQSLYKSYLQNYNYKNLFPKKEPYIWRWPLPMLWVVPVARIIGLVSGKKHKNNFYALMRYFGHVSNQFAAFKFSTHKKTYKNSRGVRSLHTRHWIKKNKNLFNKEILTSLKISSN